MRRAVIARDSKASCRHVGVVPATSRAHRSHIAAVWTMWKRRGRWLLPRRPHGLKLTITPIARPPLTLGLAVLHPRRMRMNGRLEHLHDVEHPRQRSECSHPCSFLSACPTSVMSDSSLMHGQVVSGSLPSRVGRRPQWSSPGPQPEQIEHECRSRDSDPCQFNAHVFAGGAGTGAASTRP